MRSTPDHTLRTSIFLRSVYCLAASAARVAAIGQKRHCTPPQMRCAPDAVRCSKVLLERKPGAQPWHRESASPPAHDDGRAMMHFRP